MATAIETTVIPPASVLPEGLPYRLTAADYIKMVDADIIPSDRRVGLWEGHLYEKRPKQLIHSATTSLVIMALTRAVPDDWFVSYEAPVLVNEFTVPLPDFTVVRGHPNDYCRRGSFPKADEIGLIVELADTSLRKDLEVSLPIYARAGLPVYWVVNLVAKRVEVYSQPVVEGETARYWMAETFEPGKDVPLVLDGLEVARIPARELLPEEASRAAHRCEVAPSRERWSP
jgi:Uma2 family endonuclease